MTLEFHPLCLAHRPPYSTEIDAMAADIKANGQREPITLYQGKILDGRCRYLSCLKAGVEPQFWKLPDHANAAAYVVSKNRVRRHETAGERLLAGQRVKAWREEDARRRQRAGRKPTFASTEAKVGGKAAEEAARLVGASRAGIERADKVVKKGTPELVEALRSGKVSVHKASQLADLPPAEQHQALVDLGRKPKKPRRLRNRHLDELRKAHQHAMNAFQSLQKFPDRPKGLTVHLKALAAAVAWLAALLEAS